MLMEEASVVAVANRIKVSSSKARKAKYKKPNIEENIARERA